MGWLAKASFLNTTAATLAVLAWFAGTNHCLLGLTQRPKNATVSTCPCPNHSQKTEGPDRGPSGMLACCQGLQSPKIDLAKTTIEPVLVRLYLFAIDHLALPQPPRNVLQRARYDTGPPLTGFFVETVLQRSLRENAPPIAS